MIHELGDRLVRRLVGDPVALLDIWHGQERVADEVFRDLDGCPAHTVSAKLGDGVAADLLGLPDPI